jgi:PTH1 family peptidyl-tRNA hydrolase
MTKIIIGLGNYGDKYAYTYHNMGFMVVECVADRWGVRLDKKHCSARMVECVHDGHKLILAQPWTYMNLSGVCVRQLMNYYKAQLSDILVAYDDIDIDKGTIRVRQSGSGGTHNGMRNIIDVLGSGQFVRVRVGIGRPEGMSLHDYVLSDVPKPERPLIAQGIEAAADEIVKWVGTT